MSIIDSIWDDECEEYRSEEKETQTYDISLGKETPKDYLLLDFKPYWPQMRWNHNKRETRFKICWECGIETNNFYAHRWRIPKGSISNIKCSCCFEKYKEDKRNAYDRKR